MCISLDSLYVYTVYCTAVPICYNTRVYSIGSIGAATPGWNLEFPRAAIILHIMHHNCLQLELQYYTPFSHIGITGNEKADQAAKSA